MEMYEQFMKFSVEKDKWNNLIIVTDKNGKFNWNEAVENLKEIAKDEKVYK